MKEKEEKKGATAKDISDALQSWDEQLGTWMTPEICEYVRKLRCEEGYSWRAVAHHTYDNFVELRHEPMPEFIREGWSTIPSNQLVGIALCEQAAKFFGEDPCADPWN